MMRDLGQWLYKSRGAIALVTGVVIFAIFFLSDPQTGSALTPLSNLQIGSSDKVALLEKQVKELTEKLQLIEHPQAGPFGTVKALRTNPTIMPNVSVNPRLANMLQKVAIRGELIVTLANSNVKEALEIWFTNIKRVGISNYLVIALDDPIADFCQLNSVPVFKRDPDEGIDSIGKTSNVFAVSGLKFRILREFLQLGYSVLLSDVDIIYLQNPFDSIYRDADVESMTDGQDNNTAYGYNDIFRDPSMGWSQDVHTRRIWVYNSGFFYMRPTTASIELLDRVTDTLSHNPQYWDQAVFNEYLFHPSHPGYDGLHISKRTMDFYLFMNSKVLFKFVRKDSKFKEFKPVVVHINYHPDKLARMKAVVEFYVNGKQDALEPFNDGTPRT